MKTAGENEIMQTTSVRIDNDMLRLVRDYKSITGIPIGRFIEDAIADKIMAASDEIKIKMGLTPSKLKKIKK